MAGAPKPPPSVVKPGGSKQTAVPATPGQSAQVKSAGVLNFGFGQLNQWKKPTVGAYYDSQTTSGFCSVTQRTSERFKPDAGQGQDRFRAICIEVMVPVEDGAANTWVGRLFGWTEERPKPLLAVRARIIEMEAMCKPVFGTDENEKPFYDDKAKRFYPVFIAADQKISKDIPVPGDVIEVDFGNRDERTDPVYYGKVYNNAIALNIFPGGLSSFLRPPDNPYTRPPGGCFGQGATVTGGDANSRRSRGKTKSCLTDQSTEDPRGLRWVNTADMHTAHNNKCKRPSGGVSISTIPDYPAWKWLDPGHGAGKFRATKGVPGARASRIMRIGMANAFVAMNKAMQAEKGFTVGVRSAWRSYESQVSARCRYEKGWKGAPVAVPGESNHQKGRALDLDVGNSPTNIKVGVGDKYDWLNQTDRATGSGKAAKFGFKRISIEAWHHNWSPTGAYSENPFPGKQVT